jgi:hypothetical protein
MLSPWAIAKALEDNHLGSRREDDQARHGVCFTLGQYCCAAVTDVISLEGTSMSWTKPEAEVVAVTMEVTAYVATL